MKTVFTDCLVTMNGRLDVAEQVLNALVIAGIAFFAALGASVIGGGASYPPAPSTVYTGILAGGLVFFIQLAYERGIEVADRIRERLP